MNQVKYVSDIQPPYGISRYKYYEVIVNNKDYYIIDDYGNKIYYSEQEIRDLYLSEDWDSVFVKNTIENSKDKNELEDKKDIVKTKKTKENQ